MLNFIPVTVPGYVQPLIEACTAWLVTTFLSIPVAFIRMFIETPINVLRSLCSSEPNVVLITGANSGIGASLAEAYAKPDVTLGLLARDERLEQTAEKCREKGATVTTISCDIANKEELAEALIEFDESNPIDLLIANAAGMVSDGNEWEDSWQNIIDVNFKGAVNTVMTIFKQMKERPHVGGQIAIAWHAPPQMCYYNATKTALTSLGRDLRYIGRNYNIHVNVIAPGLIGTRMTLDERRPFPFSSWLAASPENMAKIIRWNLFEDNFVITWPYHQFLPELAISSLPPRVLDSVQWLVGRAWSVVSPAKDKPLT
ncbi:8457_t:CDS:2 [Paraglomus occultum]|uniref:8457_t:CDS:1 n=1 Tax=Paraglomus occultum TaxID=144539 RepID=A0A9N9CKS4_9GLOM|nr:8457_t:CDS:2 [Paraglomus occultum]